MEIDGSKSNTCFHKRPRRDLKRSQVLANVTSIAIQLYLHSKRVAHTTTVERGVRVEALARRGVNANKSRGFVVDCSTGYGHVQPMFLPAGANNMHCTASGFKPEAFMVGGTVQRQAGTADVIILRNDCKQMIPGGMRLDVTPGFITSPASDPCVPWRRRPSLGELSRRTLFLCSS